MPPPADYQGLHDVCVTRNAAAINNLIGSCNNCYTASGVLASTCPHPANLVAFVRELAEITTDDCGSGGTWTRNYLTFPASLESYYSGPGNLHSEVG
jgi:hypothetical protein